MNWNQAFDRTLKTYRISAKWLSEQSGVSEISISKFRRGHVSMTTDTLNTLLVAMPEGARQYFFETLLGTAVTARAQTLEEMIEDMDSRSLTSVLQAIAGNLSLRLNGSALEQEAS